MKRAAALAVVLSLGLCRMAFPQDALKLFRRMQDALGGAEKLAAVRDFEQTVRAESFDANGNSIGDVRKRTRWIRPAFLRVDQVGPGSTYVLYFDGKSGWEILPGANKAVELAGGELAFAQGYVRGFFLLMWLADRDPRYKITSPAENVVRISDGDLAHQLDLMLDPTTHLPVKETSLSLSDPAHPVPKDNVYGEWIIADGLRFPNRFSVVRAGIRIAEAKSVDEIRINRGLKIEDLSAKPADGKPVISQPAPR